MSCNLCDLLKKRDGNFIVEWPVHVWRLADDQTWPGWSLLIYREHATELFEVSAEARAAMIEEVSRAAEILKKAFNADKMNVELLGNQEPHMHWHIVPRRNDDPAWNKPIWTHDHKPRPLHAKAHDAALGRIRKLLPQVPPTIAPPERPRG